MSQNMTLHAVEYTQHLIISVRLQVNLLDVSFAGNIAAFWLDIAIRQLTFFCNYIVTWTKPVHWLSGDSSTWLTLIILWDNEQTAWPNCSCD